MVEIIPAILSKSVEDFNEKIDRVKPYVSMVHIDMMDNKFVPNKTLGPDEIPPLVEGLDYEFHWMYENPEPHLAKFPESLHLVNVEVLTQEKWQRMKTIVKRIGIAINPPTPFSELEPYINETNEFLVMSVNPGFSGQSFLPEVLPKVKQIRGWLDEINPQAAVEVDGGVNPATIQACYQAGARIFVAASAIFKHPRGIAAGITSLTDLL